MFSVFAASRSNSLYCRRQTGCELSRCLYVLCSRDVLEPRNLPEEAERLRDLPELGRLRGTHSLKHLQIRAIRVEGLRES